MEKEKNNTGIIVLLLIIILGLAGYIAYDKVFTKEGTESKPEEKEEQTNNGEEESTKYKAYKKGDELTLSDGSKWLVITDSDENTDYVTALSAKDYSTGDFPNGTDILNELYSSDIYYDSWYSNSKIKEYFDSKITSLPVTLKEVDDYKIRLIKVQEVIDFDSNWEYNEERDTYYYKGTNFNQYFKLLLTMTPSKCRGNTNAGKCMPMYSISGTSSTGEYYISHWLLGPGGFNPVINIEKTSLK